MTAVIKPGSAKIKYWYKTIKPGKTSLAKIGQQKNLTQSARKTNSLNIDNLHITQNIK